MKYNGIILLAIMAFTLTFTSCSTKAKTSNGNTNSNAQQHNQDVSNVKSENDNVNTDVNNVMANMSAFGKTGSNQANYTICGATIDSTGATGPQPYFTINFDGVTVCPNPNRIRSGSIKVQLISGAHWSTAGAVALLTYTNYKVTYPALNNQFICFNGTKLLTDVSGINWLTYYLSGGLTATLRDRSYNMTVTFDNNQTSSWNCARLTTWTITNYTTITATVNGDTTIGGKTIDSWGQTRYGTKFTTQMLQPWQSGTTCGWWNPTQGQYTSVTDSFTVSALLGVNSSGTQVSSGCAYGYKLDWALTSGNYSGSVILPYW